MKNAGFFRSKWLITTMHLMLWGLVFLLPFIGDRAHGIFPVPPLLETIGTKLCWVFLFYFNAYFLVPRFFSRKRIPFYFLSIAGMLVLFVLLENLVFHPAIMQEFRGHFKLKDGGTLMPRPFFVTIFPYFFIIAISTTFRLVTSHLKEEDARKERETVSLRSELTFLRSQVNPHFIFNVLNSMVSLARKKSNLVEPSLIRLSGLLHYMLYVPDEKISLQREVDYLEDYIDLQQLRFGGQVNIRTLFSTDETAGQLHLEPMLLITFVENAFKHGTEVLDSPFINVVLMQQDHELSFEVTNKYTVTNSKVSERSSGIGLSNVYRRLDLLYPGKYKLSIQKEKNIHYVHLQISLA